MAAVALAVARGRGGRGDAKLDAFLERQSALADAQRRLVELQAEQLHQDHRLHHRHLALRFLGDRLRVGLQLIAMAFGLAIATGLAIMAWQAHEDHSLVVESFTVPADMAARGATGQAVAEELMNRVAAIRSFTNVNSLSHSDDVRADQADGLKVEIPETGVSIGEIERFLHRWLGHETLLTGAVRDAADGRIVVSLHIAGADPIDVNGPAADFDALMQQTAEKAFAAFDPGNYVVYLSAVGRPDEALAAAQASAMEAGNNGESTMQQASAYSLWASAENESRRALSHALIAIELDPRAMVAWMEAANASQSIGHNQAAVDYARRLIETRIDDQPPALRAGFAHILDIGRVTIADATGDFAALTVDYRVGFNSVANHYALAAQAAARAHDVSGGRRLLDLAVSAGPDGVRLRKARWYVSSIAGDWRQALVDARAMVDAADQEKAKAAGTGQAGAVEQSLQTVYRPWLALAEAMTGDIAAAQALIAGSPPDCEICVQTRARIAELAGDRASADRWFAEAVRQAPRLPMTYQARGEALLARGDLAGAAANFAQASRFGPRFADPLKGSGDVLARQGQWKAALARYDAALKITPAWTQLRQARDAAARHAG